MRWILHVKYSGVCLHLNNILTIQITIGFRSFYRFSLLSLFCIFHRKRTLTKILSILVKYIALIQACFFTFSWKLQILCTSHVLFRTFVLFLKLIYVFIINEERFFGIRKMIILQRFLLVYILNKRTFLIITFSFTNVLLN